MLDGYSKLDPPTQKMLPIEADVPELLVKVGYGKGGMAHAKAIGNLHDWVLLPVTHWGIYCQRVRLYFLPFSTSAYVTMYPATI